uniref:Uncharacterized protein n=1 Tax=Anguilla anguilla TaxID=7936 RepID=A0A0E9XWY6_ANGAN
MSLACEQLRDITVALISRIYHCKEPGPCTFY